MAAVAAVCLLSLLLRLPFLSVPLTADEAGYAYVSYWLSRGLALYQDLWFDRPQGIFIVYGAILRWFGTTTESIRFAAALYNAATVAALFFLGKRLSGQRAGLWAAALYAVCSASPAIEGFTANGELFMNLPLVGALLLAHARLPLPAGAALLVATAIKPTALPTAAPALLVLVALRAGCEAPHRSGAWQRSLLPLARDGAAVAAGALLAAAPFVAHGLAAGPRAYWYAVVGFRLEAHSALSAGGRFFHELWQTGPHVLVSLLPLWLLVAAWCCRRRFRTLGAFHLAFLLGALAGAALGGYWYWHYFTALLPPASLVAGQVLARQRWLARVRLPLPQAALRPRALAALGVGLASAAFAVALNARLVGATPEDTSWRVYRSPGYLSSGQVAAYLRANTDPEDTVFAAFAQPDLYYLSGRRSAGRHLYWTEINRVPGALDAVEAALDAEEPRRGPRYVVRVQADLETPGRASRFWERVERRYEEEIVIGGITLYRRRDRN